jgi:LAO/AO transport system kinase
MTDDQSLHHARSNARAKIKAHHLDNRYELLVQKLIEGDRNALSQLITKCESTLPKDRELIGRVLHQIMPNTGNSLRIGITGVPGVGKSTFIERFGMNLIADGYRVAVLTVDPSSPVTKGSILGDKTRMPLLSNQPHAFIRPSASSLSLGGVNRNTRESILLCEAAGFNVIIVETVGVGQSETMVREMTDFFLLLMLAGAGDQLQGIKRGIMEMCDGLVITKADLTGNAAAKKAEAEYQSALHFFPPRDSGWMPFTASCSAIENRGVDVIWTKIKEHQEWMIQRDLFQHNRRQQEINCFKNAILSKLEELFFSDPENTKKLELLQQAIKDGELSSFAAIDQLFGV